MFEESLRRLGLNDREIKVYLLVLRHKRISPAEVAKLSRINRTTVYAIAKALVAKGLLLEDASGKAIHLLPAPAAELQKLLRKEEREMKARENSINDLIKELSLTQIGAEYSVPKIRFVEDADVEDYLRDHFKTWLQSMQKYDSTWWGFQDHSFVENYRSWIDWSWKNAPVDIELKLLSNESQIEQRLKGKYAKRHIKFWKKSANFTATTWIMGDYIAFISTGQKPFYLVEIHDALMAHNLREVFRNLWDSVE